MRGRPRRPDLTADVWLYSAEEVGRTLAARSGYGCVCIATGDRRQGGWDARLQLDAEPLAPGARRRVGFWFLTAEGAAAMRQAGRFHLWEGRVVGEAEVVA